MRLTGAALPNGGTRSLAKYLRDAGLAPREAFLAACRLEDEARHAVRTEAGLPDWHELPENKDKIPPPWRVSKEIPKALKSTALPNGVRFFNQDVPSL